LKNANIPWLIKTETLEGLSETLKFDLLVVATGLFSEPHIPLLRDQDKFTGSIVHSNAIKSQEQLINKHVVVIGGSKCATDMAVLAGSFAKTCHLIFRRAHWMVPRAVMGGYLPLRFLYSHLFCIPFKPFPDVPHTALFHFVHWAFPRFFIKAIENMGNDIIATHGPHLFDDKIFMPCYPYRNVENMSVIPTNFIRLKREGRIVGKLGFIDKIVDDSTIQLNTGEQLQVDMIICATGFIERFPFFSHTDAQAMGLPTKTTSGNETEFSLYRRILPVGVPNVAFIGFTAAPAHWMIAEVASHWISEYFLGRLKLPLSEKEMHKEIMTNRIFIHQLFNRNGCYLNYYWLAALEIYMNDMGLPLHRTNNWISEYFCIYRPERLKSLHEERQAKANGKQIKRRWYFGFSHTLIVVFLLLVIFNLYIRN
jgi:dimethylaniline monooxygenase (N-oxide forming)